MSLYPTKSWISCDAGRARSEASWCDCWLAVYKYICKQNNKDEIFFSSSSTLIHMPRRRVTQGRTHKVTTMISRSNSYLRRSIIISRCRSSSYLGSVPFMASDGAEDPMNVLLYWSGHNIRPWGLLLFTIYEKVFSQN